MKKAKKSIKTKKTLGLLVTLAILTVCLGLPSGAEAAVKNEVTLVHIFNSGAFKTAMDTLWEKFDKIHPEIKVNASIEPGETFKTTVALILSGEKPPDLFIYWGGVRGRTLIDHGLVRDLSSLWHAKGYDKTLSKVGWDVSTCYGKQYSIPIIHDDIIFTYNKRIFDRLGLTEPRTWDHFLKICQTLKTDDIVPLTIGNKFRWPAQFWFDFILLRTAGLEFHDRLMEGLESYQDPSVERAAKIWADLVEKGYFIPSPSAYDDAECLRFLAKDEAAMTLLGQWPLNTLKYDVGWTPEVDYDIFNFPIIDPGVPDIGLGNSMGFFMSSAALHPEPAEVLLDFLASKEAQEVVSIMTGSMTSHVGVTEYRDPIQADMAKYFTSVQKWSLTYDVKTTPEMADVGLDAFIELMTYPQRYKQILSELEGKAKEVFKR